MFTKKVTFNFFKIFLIISSIIVSITFIAGYNYDSFNYLTGLQYKLSDGNITRHHIISLIFFRYGALFPNINIACITYIFLSGYFLYLEYKFIVSNKFRQHSKIFFIDLFIFSPYIIAYILLPGKESVVFHVLAASICLYLNCFKYIIPNYIRTFIILFSTLFASFIRPTLLFSIPFFLKVNFLKKNRSKKIWEWDKVSYSDFILIVITFAIVLFTINNRQTIIASVEQIIFQSSYEYGNTSTGIIASRFDIIDFSQIFPYILQSVFFGIPIGLTTQYSLKTMILVGLYAFNNIMSAYYIYFCIQKLYFKRLFFLNLIIFFLVFISFFISSSAFLVNTGTAFRYYSSFFSLIWLSFIHTRYN